MSDLFPKAGFMRTGYDRNQVQEFFAKVRESYEKPVVDPSGMTPLDIRRAAFDLARGGYKTDAVDTALDRLEDAFASRLRDQFVRQYGQDAWNAQVGERAQVLYERLRRPKKDKFSSPAGLRKGYDAKAVDALLDRMAIYFDGGEPVTPHDIRSSSFARKPKWAAYDERQVDAYLAKAVDILLGVS